MNTREAVAKAVSVVLRGVVAREERYWLNGAYVRWGLVESDIIDGVCAAISEEVHPNDVQQLKAEISAIVDEMESRVAGIHGTPREYYTTKLRQLSAV